MKIKKSYILLISLIFIIKAGITQVDDFAGSTLNFDGGGKHVNGLGIDNTFSEFTLEAWIYNNSLTNTVQRYVTIGQEVAVLRHDGTANGGNNELHFYIKSQAGNINSIRVDDVLTTDQWIHIAGTYDGSTMRLYLNGELIGTKSVSEGGLTAPNGDFDFSSGSETMNGKIDETRLWNYVRTDQEIRENMYSLTNTNGLIHYWQFNENSGSTLSDVIGGADGNLNSMDNSNWVDSTIPFGTGNSSSNTISTTGPFSFSQCKLTMNFTSISGSIPITASCIDTIPNVIPSSSESICESQYWIINKFSNETFECNLTFTTNEDISILNEQDPSTVSLFSRDNNSDGDWTFVSHATSANSSSNTITFNSITNLGQFIIGKHQPDTERGTALSFDGVDDYVELATNTSYDFDASFSIETWIKAESMTEGYHTIAQKGEEWQIKVFATPNFYIFEFGINNNAIFSSLQLDASSVVDKWIHLAGIVNQTTGSESTLLYVNGISGSIKSASAITVSSTNLKIGELFKGEIDEFRVWGLARTLSQIRENKHLTSSSGDANITTYLQFNEGTGTVATDIFGGNDGTLTNMNTSDAWVNSNAPIGNGVSITKTETAGIVNFTGIGITANYTSHSSASVTISRINGAPNLNPNLFDNQYWILERYGSGNFDADLIFTVDENLNADDEQSASQVKLYNREENADTYWDYNKSANGVNSANKTVEFNNISCAGQFAICRRFLPDNFAGNTLFFNGIDDNVNFGNSTNLDIKNNITVEVWIKPDELNKNRRILSKGDNNFFEWDDEFESVTGKGIQIDLPALNTGWWEFQYNMNYNQWYHIAFTYSESGELKAYINGYNVRTGTFAGDIGINTSELTLASNGSDSPFFGLVDELRIWNKVRSQEQIRENMCSTLSGLEQGLISYWQFNESQGDTLPDLVGGNNGQLNNMSNTNWLSSLAPLPFISAQDGSWNSNDSWLSGQNYPDSAWSKVRINNSITLETSKEVMDLSITSSGTLNCSPLAQLTVNDSLSNDSGTNGLILNSDISNTASLILNSSNISAQVETYITAGQWHFISPPISSATVNDYYFPGSTTSWMKWWDEFENDYVYITDINAPLNVGQGYAVWFANEKSDETVNYSGSLNSDNVSLNLSFSDSEKGYNLIGNPFTSPLDWDIGSWINNNITGIAYVWDNGNYISRNSIGEGSLTDGIIPSGQGFFVQAGSADASITIPLDARVHYSQTFYKNNSGHQSNQQNNSLQITVTNCNKKDKTWISFNELSSNEWDEGIDAIRIVGEDNQPQLYTKYENENLSIQSFELLSGSVTIPLYFVPNSDGTFSLSFDYMESFTDTDIWIEDKIDDYWAPLSQGANYTFSAKICDNPHRFDLHFHNGTTSLGPDFEKEENAHIWYANGQLNIDLDESLGKLNKVEIINILGQIIYSDESPNNKLIRINKPSFSSYVIVVVYTQNTIINKKVFMN